MQHNDHQDNLTPKGDSDIVSWKNVWRIVPDFFIFLKRPYIPSKYQKFSMLSAVQWFILLCLDFFLITFAIIIILEPYAENMSIPDPEIFEEDETLWEMLLWASIIAPLIEETLFRGWLKGTKRALIILAAIVSYCVSLYLIGQNITYDLRYILGISATILYIFVSLLALKKYWSDVQPVNSFAASFPYIFYMSAISFGVLHIFNYEHHSLLQLLPMIIPQIIGGLILGYIRLHFGLWAAIIMHAMSNGILVSLIWIFPEI